MNESDNRRPLKSRSAGWARTAAATLARAGVFPDAVSASSLIFALAGFALLILSGSADGIARSQLLVLAAITIQLRLLANLLDGMVAVEHGRGGPFGPIWNELPDRIADALFLVGAGYGAAAAGFDWAAPVGWLCAFLAVLTAYVRELGRGLGFPANFAGPMAKPHRMALLTGLCLVSAAEGMWGWHGQTLAWGLGALALGTAATVVRRTVRLAGRLRSPPP